MPRAWPIAGGRISVGLVTGSLVADEATGQLCELACRLDRNRHRVYVYALSSELEETCGSRLRASGVALTSFARRRAWEATRLLALTRALRDDRIDLVHVIRPAAVLYGGLAARLAGIATVVVAVRQGERLPSGLARYLLGDLYRRATVVVANSSAYEEEIAATFGVCPERTRVVHDGVDLARFPVPGMLEGLRERVSTGRPLVAAVGTADQGGVFATAAQRVLLHEPQARFVWCGGNASELAEVERGWCARGIPVTVRDGFEHLVDELPRIAMLWALGAAHEQARAAVLRAMAAARPVIVMRGGGLEELVADEVSGFVVEREDGEAFADRGVTLLHNGARRRAVGLAARAHAESTFAIDTTVRAMATLYEGAMLGCVAYARTDAHAGESHVVARVADGREVVA